MQEHECIVGDDDEESDGPRSDTRGAWQQVTQHLSTLGSTLREHYTSAGQDEVVQELRTAVEEFTRAAGRLGSATSQAMADPDVADQVKATMSAVAAAVAHTVQDIASDTPGNPSRGVGTDPTAQQPDDQTQTRNR